MKLIKYLIAGILVTALCFSPALAAEKQAAPADKAANEAGTVATANTTAAAGAGISTTAVVTAALVAAAVIGGALALGSSGGGSSSALPSEIIGSPPGGPAMPGESSDPATAHGHGHGH